MQPRYTVKRFGCRADKDVVLLDNGTVFRSKALARYVGEATELFLFGATLGSRVDSALRRMALKSATDEVLWIWQRKSNNIHDLHSHIWDEWADADGSIGKAYGYQMGVKHFYRDVTREGLEKAFGEKAKERIEASESLRRIREAKQTEDGLPYTDGKEEKTAGENTQGYFLDQVDRVIYDLKNNPFSRRIMTNLYAHGDLSEMNLYPCAYGMTFNVTQKKGADRLTLNAVLNQRSQDVLAANNWNVVQYAVLVHMLAQVCGMEAGELVHVIADAHIYDRHVPLIKELISRTPYPAPEFHLNPDVHDFYAFTRNDVSAENYRTGEQIKDIPIAV